MRVVLFFLVLWVSAASAQSTLPSAPHVYVQGVGQIEVEPDVLKLSGSMTVVSPVAATAEETIFERSALLLATTRDLAILADQIKVSPLSVAPNYEYSNGRSTFSGYRVGRDFVITLTDLDSFYDALLAIVQTDTLDQIETVFSYSQMDEAVADAQLAALDDARARAERLAERAGANVGAVYSISEFNLRQEEQYMLEPSRAFYESELGSAEDVVIVTGTRIRRAPFNALFQIDTVTAAAEVYVVYYLEPR